MAKPFEGKETPKEEEMEMREGKHEGGKSKFGRKSKRHRRRSSTRK